MGSYDVRKLLGGIEKMDEALRTGRLTHSQQVARHLESRRLEQIRQIQADSGLTDRLRAQQLHHVLGPGRCLQSSEHQGIIIIKLPETATGHDTV